MKKNIALLIFLILSITYVVSANRTIRGVIKDQSDEPIIGATIQLKGTTLGTVTNIDGEFSLSVPEGYGTLTVQFIGLESQDITLDNKDFYEIILREDNTALNEVVVVGYGSRVMRSMTGAAMSVSSAGLQASANGKTLALSSRNIQ